MKAVYRSEEKERLARRQFVARRLRAYIHPVPEEKSDLTDAKIAAAEARGDVKIARLEGKLDTIAASINGKFEALSANLTAISAEQARVHDDIRALSSQVSGARTTTIVTAIASVLAIVGAVIGVMAFGGDQLGRGMEIRKVVDEAIQDSVKKAPPPQTTIETDGRQK